MPDAIKRALFADDADLLDGKDSTAFATAGHDHDSDYLAKAGKAADADRLDGVDGPDLRSLPLNVYSELSGSAASSDAGILFPADSDGTLRITFIVPPAHDPSADLFVDIVLLASAPCSLKIYTPGSGYPIGGSPAAVNWRIPGVSTATSDATIDLPPGTLISPLTFVLEADTEFDTPGNALTFRFSRDGDHTADTCDWVYVVAAQLRY